MDKIKTVNSDKYIHLHKGEEIHVYWQLIKHEDEPYETKYTERIQFEYNNIEIIEFYNKGTNTWYEITEFMCNTIEKLGKEKFRVFKEYYNKLTKFHERYIVVDNKVFKPYVTTITQNPRYYIVKMKMSDNSILDGSTYINEQGMNPFHKQHCDKDRLIKVLRHRVLEYFETKKILPNEKDHLQMDQTIEYSQIISWFTEHKIEYIIGE